MIIGAYPFNPIKEPHKLPQREMERICDYFMGLADVLNTPDEVFDRKYGRNHGSDNDKRRG